MIQTTWLATDAALLPSELAHSTKVLLSGYSGTVAKRAWVLKLQPRREPI